MKNNLIKKLIDKTTFLKQINDFEILETNNFIIGGWQPKDKSCSKDKKDGVCNTNRRIVFIDKDGLCKTTNSSCKDGSC
jgi:hypothetical protein